MDSTIDLTIDPTFDLTFDLILDLTIDLTNTPSASATGAISRTPRAPARPGHRARHRRDTGRDTPGAGATGGETFGLAGPQPREDLFSSRALTQLRLARTHDTNTKPKPISRWGVSVPLRSHPPTSDLWLTLTCNRKS